MSAVGTTPLQSQGAMRVKPEMKPWVYTNEK